MKQTPLKIFVAALVPWLALLTWLTVKLSPYYGKDTRTYLKKFKEARPGELSVGELVLARNPKTNEIWWWPSFWITEITIWAGVVICVFVSVPGIQTVSNLLIWISNLICAGAIFGLPCARMLLPR